MQCRYNQHPAPFSSARRPIFLRIASIRRTLQRAQAFALIARCNARQTNQPKRLLENEKRIMPHTVVPATSNRTMHTVPQQPPLRWFVLYFNPDTRCNAMWAYVQVVRSLFHSRYMVQRNVDTCTAATLMWLVLYSNYNTWCNAMGAYARPIKGDRRWIH